MGNRAASIKARATGWLGIRMPTKPVEAVIFIGMQEAALPTMVRGPGQNLSASVEKSASPAFGSTNSSSAASLDVT